MARIGVFIQCVDEQGARVVLDRVGRLTLFSGSIVRLRDPAVPSLTKRVGVLEEQAKQRSADVAVMFHDVSKAAFERLMEVEQRLDALETAPQPIRPEPGSVPADPTHEQIEDYLRASGKWEQMPLAKDTRFVSERGYVVVLDDANVAMVATAEGVTPAEMRARILAASSTTAEDPDRLAKVAHRAEIDKHLARPYTDADFAALLPQGRDRLRRIACDVAEANGLQNDVLAKDLDDMSAERDALRARAKKAEAEAERKAFMLAEVDAALKTYALAIETPNGRRGELIGSLVADWQKRGERLTAMKGRRAEDMRRGFEIGKANDDDWSRARQVLESAIAVTEPIAHVPDGEPRDPVKNPQGGEWFLDEDDGTVRGVLWGDRLDGEVAYLFEGQQLPRSLDLWRRDRAAGRARLMTTDEVDAFKSHGTRPSKAP